MASKGFSNRKKLGLGGFLISHIERQQSSPPSVIVIGGGISGIAAARALCNASFNVILLESRDRLGGRVHTDYSFGCPVDMGASWLHGVCNENSLAPLIRSLGLRLYRTSGDNSVLYDHDLESYALFDKDGNQVPQQVVIKVGETFERILKEEHVLTGGHGLMVQGYHPVIQALAKNIDIHLNHRVKRIVQRNNRVIVTVQNGNTFVADAAIITVPLGVLKANLIEFEPKLPEWKLSAISDLGVGIENKIALRFDKVFWPNVEVLGLVAQTSYACGYFLNLHKATGHPVLVYMTAGRFAYDIEKLSDEEAVDFVMLQLRKMIPDATDPIQHLVSRWGTDPDSLGAYSCDLVGKPADLYERLCDPVDNLYFAGEAASADHSGSVHGAYTSGIMAAEVCRRRLSVQHGVADLLQLVMREDLTEAMVPLQISRM